MRGKCFSVLPLPKEPEIHWASGIGQLTRSPRWKMAVVFFEQLGRGIWFKNLVFHIVSRFSINISSKTRLSTIFLDFSRIWVYKVYNIFINITPHKKKWNRQVLCKLKFLLSANTRHMFSQLGWATKGMTPGAGEQYWPLDWEDATCKPIPKINECHLKFGTISVGKI